MTKVLTFEKFQALGDMMLSSIIGRHSEKVSLLLNSAYTMTKVPTFEKFQAFGEKMRSSIIGRHSEKVSSLLNSAYTTMTKVPTFENFQEILKKLAPHPNQHILIHYRVTLELTFCET